MHTDYDMQVERIFRGRHFRRHAIPLIDERFPAPTSPKSDDDTDEEDISEDGLWKHPEDLGTVDYYISRKLRKLRLRSLAVPNSKNYSNYTSPPSSPKKSTYNDFDEYPKGIDIGDRDKQCPYCGGYCFRDETTWICCRNGKIWIPPLRMLPNNILRIFEKKFSKYLLEANASFSMCSVRFIREAQAPHGVQTMKTKGLISAHPSAVNQKGTDPKNAKYANFIVLQCDNNEIAELRLNSMKFQKFHKELLEVFKGIQKFMVENNRLYESYKSMKDMEEEYKKDNGVTGVVYNEKLTFRIVPPGELSDKEYKELESHNGVYARPSRMGDGYITVAYTWDKSGDVKLPRGLSVYPRNPNTNPRDPSKKPEDPIQPLSIYSELVDPMCYPFFFPDGLGGWGRGKYPRTKEKEKLLFGQRLKNLKEHLEKNNDSLSNYCQIDQLPKDIREMVEGKPMNDEQPPATEDEIATAVADVADEMEEVDEMGEDDESEDDPLNYDDDDILAMGDLEDHQEVPEFETAGFRLPTKVIERDGERYVVVDPVKAAQRIALTSVNPFGEGEQRNYDSDDEEAPFGKRFELESDDEEQPVVNRFRDGTDDFAEEEARGEDIEVAQGCVEADDMDVGSDDENVCFGDQHNAERTAEARANDGVRVKNVGEQLSVSLAAFSMFIMQDRPGWTSRFQGGARVLGQLLIIDLACRIMEQRMDALSSKRAEFPRAFPRSVLMKHYGDMIKEKFKGVKELGMLVTMPSTVPGTAKYQRELVMSAVKIANELGNPHLFITFTGNPNWPEIKRACEQRKCTWADIPDFTNRVFKRRYEMFLEDVIGEKKKMSSLNGKYVRQPGMFGNVVWYNYSVEFQQRGMPHCHLLICLQDGIVESAQIDNIISANVPEYPHVDDPKYEDKLRYYQLVRDMMTHFPCKGNPTAYCNLEKKKHWKQCCKGFPKPYAEFTTMSDNQYPVYRRTDDEYFALHRGKETIRAGSEYVVAHNRQLLMKYECHMNIEIVTSIKTMKYMFKYIHKGSDRVLLEASEKVGKGSLAPDQMTLCRNVFCPSGLPLAKKIQRQQQAHQAMTTAGFKVDKDKHVALNDCSYKMDMAAMTACEAAWRIAGFPMHGSSHIVHRAYINEEGRDVIQTTRGVDAAKAKTLLKKKVKGMMQAWFDANKTPDDLPKRLSTDPQLTTNNLTLDEMFKYYKWEPQKNEFVLRKRDHSHRFLGRIQAPQPRYLQLTATRLLAQTVRGPTSWEELRTYEGVEYPTCLDAAKARGLMNGVDEWERALKEISDTEFPIICRRFFASILIHCAPANPRELWEKHWENLVESARNGWTDEQRKAHALRHIQWLLGRHGMTLIDFQLDEQYNDADFPLASDENIDNPDVTPRTTMQHKKDGEKMYKNLNKEQKKFVDRALNLDMECDKKRMICVEAPGGTGKTYCYKTIYHLLRGRGRKVICVSHTGIAACLLPDGCTAHRKFSIPLTIGKDFVCKIDPSSPEGILLSQIDCIIWDEICMTDYRILHAVNVLLKQLKQNDLPFGGVLMVMGGDWRQILPIVEGVRGRGVLPYIIKNGDLWKEVEKFTLTQNKRAEKDPAYARRILQIGDGSNYTTPTSKMVHIPEEFIIRTSDKDLADWVFPDVNDLNITKNAALLTVDNRTALRMNEYILDKVDGDVRVFESIDEPDTDFGLAADQSVFHSQTPSGMPPHKLRLKIGAQVVLLRNISVEQGLCNGTRLTVKKFGTDLIKFSVNNPTSHSPETVFLHRMLMTPTGKGADSAGFKRLQYPIRLAYACTINKSQGQTLSRCGLILHSEVFSHGQLYVAMSRVQCGDDFRLWHTKRRNSEYDNLPQGGMLIRNVVYEDVFDSPKEMLEETGVSKNTVIVDRCRSPRYSSDTDDSFDMPVGSIRTSKYSKSVTKMPYLRLENSDHLLNAIIQTLFSCSELRAKYRECNNPTMQPMGTLLGRIYRDEVQSSEDLALALPAGFRNQNNIILEVFDHIMQILSNEDRNHLEMEYDYSGCCETCQQPHIDRPDVKFGPTHIPITLTEDSYLMEHFEVYKQTRPNNTCIRCGDTTVPGFQTSHLIFTIKNPGNFKLLGLDTGYSENFFGRDYVLRTFTQHLTSSNENDNRYQTWVQKGSDWISLQNNQVCGKSAWMKLDSIVTSMVVFECKTPPAKTTPKKVSQNVPSYTPLRSILPPGVNPFVIAPNTPPPRILQPANLDQPYLLLENNDNDCFCNSICNMLYNCPDIRDKYINCTDKRQQPFGYELGRIFRREVINVKKLRKLFPSEYRKGQHDINEIFNEVFRKKLAREDLRGLNLMKFDDSGRCPGCNTPNHEKFPELDNFSHIKLKLPADSSFEACLEQFLSQHRDSNCIECNTRNPPKFKNSYLIVDVQHQGSRFTTGLTSDSVIKMFGSEYQLASFSEYKPASSTMRAGHYISWVDNGWQWERVNDDKLGSDHVDFVDFKNLFSSLFVFKKI